MRIFLTVIIISLTSLVAFSQQERFIYLESGNKQPFYVKFDNKILNSAAAGYLIIPKLADSIYSFAIGFVQNKTEKNFEYTISRKDAGFLIKNVDDKQWNLINLQTLAALSPGEVAEKKTNNFFTTEIQNDAFSVMLANAVHDSTILQKDVAVIPVLKEKILVPKDSDSLAAIDTTQMVAANDTAAMKPAVKKKLSKAPKTIHNNSVLLKKNIAKNAIPKNVNEQVVRDSSQITDTTKVVAISRPLVKQKSAKNIAALHDSAALKKAIAKKNNLKKINDQKDSIQNIIAANNVIKHASVIKRDFVKNSEEGLELIYVDAHDKRTDTIRILILADSSSDKKFVADKIKTDSVLSTLVVTDSILHKDLVADKPKANTLPDSISAANKQIVKLDSVTTEIRVNTIKADTVKTESTNLSMINSDCKNFATDDDFLKLRKKMVAENDDEGMIKIAKKVFKTRCFTTEQIKNLSVLFLKDKGKYMFFDASYPFVSNTEKFSALENQLSDNYYLTRFRAMIHK